MSYTVEKDWQTKAGYRAVVIMTDSGHRCGYVGVPETHKLWQVHYSDEGAGLKITEDEPIDKRGALAIFSAMYIDINSTKECSPRLAFNVHGSITFSGHSKFDSEHSLWWFGFDCAHAWDLPSPEYCAELKAKYPDAPYMWKESLDATHKTLEFCVAECESLADQLNWRVNHA